MQRRENKKPSEQEMQTEGMIFKESIVERYFEIL